MDAVTADRGIDSHVIVDVGDGVAEVHHVTTFSDGRSWGMYLFSLQYDSNRNIIGTFDIFHSLGRLH